MHLGIHLAGFEDVGKVAGLFEGEVAGNRRLSAFDFVVDVGRGVNLVVEDDSHLMTHVLAGDASPLASAFGVHAHRHFNAADGVGVGSGVANGFAVECGLAAVGLEGVEGNAVVHLIAVGIGVDGGLHTPAETEVGGQKALCGGSGEDGVDGSLGLGVGGVAYGCAVASACEHALKGGHVDGGVGSEAVEKCAEGRSELLVGVRFVEFEVGGALEEVTHAGVVLHTGEFEENLTVLTLEHLNVGRHNAELVDTVAEDVGCGIVDTVLHLALESGAHGGVAHAGLNDVLEGNREVGLGLGLAVECDEGVYEIVALVRLNHAVCTGESGLEGRVGGTALHGAHHVGHVDLKDNVHAALEVEAEAYALLAYFIESVIAQIHFFLAEGVHVVLVGLVVGCIIVVARFHFGILGGLGFVLVRHVGEGQVEEAHEHQENGYHAGNDAT